MSFAVNWMRGIRRLWLALSTCWCLFIVSQLWSQVTRPKRELTMTDVGALYDYEQCRQLYSDPIEAWVHSCQSPESVWGKLVEHGPTMLLVAIAPPVAAYFCLLIAAWIIRGFDIRWTQPKGE